MAFPKVKISDDSGNTVGVDTSSNALHVKLVESVDLGTIGDVDVLSVIPGYGIDNLGKRVADAVGVGGTANVGVMPVAVRNDDLVGVGGTDNTFCPLQVNNIGALYVHLDTTGDSTNAFNIASSTASSSQSGMIPLIKMNDAVTAPSGHIDNDWTYFQTNIKGALYTTGGEVEDSAVQSQPSLIGGRYDSSPRTLDNGDAGAVALSARGEVIVNVPAGQQTWVAREDTSHSSTDYGVTAMTVRNDVLATLSSDDADGDYQPLQVDAQGALYTTHGITGGADGTKVILSAGSDLVLGGDVPCKKVDIQAQTDNTGLIAIGFTGVDATEADGTGIILRAGDTYSLEINNLNLIYVDATVSGEGVRFTYFT